MAKVGGVQSQGFLGWHWSRLCKWGSKGQREVGGMNQHECHVNAALMETAGSLKGRFGCEHALGGCSSHMELVCIR